MRIATYNVEWFNSLFDDAGQPLADDEPSGRQGVTRARQLEALGIVFTALNADMVMVIEAPDHNGRRSTVTALESFARVFDLRVKQAIIGFPNDTQQEIALMYDPFVVTPRHDPLGEATGKKGSDAEPRFDGTLRIDLDLDGTEDLVSFSKPPLELELITARGDVVRMIGAHLKSKAPHGARGRDAIMRLAISNRRKQQAQAVWIRRRVASHLERGDPLILLGDLNDGPGLDEYEDLFGRSSVEVVMGPDGESGLHDPHARQAVRKRPGIASPTTARFYIHHEKRYLEALLDYIMVSPDLMERHPRWRIWHPFHDPSCWSVAELRDALIDASDHYPVTLDIDL
ncbi:MAG: endonuclease/exonuclease/phosphatase family protein [Paracoccaceae bacterium]|jgi:endonuclease/exonuclease/phosphatase family metal-dependent hydrolase|nr:endonuclease/exonuclease/phosphatase family protein [Paracoccaceae bacterium]